MRLEAGGERRRAMFFRDDGGIDETQETVLPHISHLKFFAAYRLPLTAYYS